MENTKKVTDSSNSRLSPPYAPTIHKISIDKLRIMCDFNIGFIGDLVSTKDRNLVFEHNEDFSVFYGHYIDEDMNKLAFGYDKYKAISTKSRNLWIEFNPNKFQDFELLEKILFQYCNNASATRLDLAFDIETDLSNYKVHEETPVSERLFLGRTKRLETRYLGSPNSDLQIRIYNKKLELWEKGRIEIDQELLWRFEIQLKTKKIHDLKKSLDNVLFYLPDYEQVETVQQKAMLFYLNENPNAWSEIDPKTKTRYRKMIKETQDFFISEIMKKELYLQTDRLIYELNNYLDMFNSSKKITLNS